MVDPPRVISTPGGRPRAVRRVLDAWRAGNRWWHGERPSQHLLVELEDGHAAEVAYENGGWVLERTLDG